MELYGLKHGKPQKPGYGPDGQYVPNEYYMRLAIRYAAECVVRGQHPVGAIVTRIVTAESTETGKRREYEMIAGVGINRVVQNSSRHAEVEAIGHAEHFHGRRELGELAAVLYTTHEPCPMCAGLVANSKLRGVVYGTSAEDAAELVVTQGIKWRSNAVSGLDVIRGRIEPGVPEQFIIGGFMQEECLDLLRSAGQLALAEPAV